MIVLQVEIADLAAFQLEGDPPVPRDRNAPGSRAVAGKLVNVPTGRSFKRGHVCRRLQRSENAADPVYEVGPDGAVVVVFDEALQAPGTGAADLHPSMYGE